MTDKKKPEAQTEGNTTENKAPAKVERTVQNDVTRPLSGTLCGQAWDLADQMSNAKGSPVAVADLLVETNKIGLNEANVKAEYSRWRKFHGITGRIRSEAAIAKDAEREAAKAKREEEKAAKKLEREEAKAKKEAEREAKKAEKEAEKTRKAEAAAKKAEKEAEKQRKAEEAAAKKVAAEEAKNTPKDDAE